MAVVASARAGLADDDPKEFAPRGLVVDVNRAPIPGAKITLHRWDGLMSPALQTTTTDANGRFEFSSRLNDAYYYVVIRKAPYAPVELIVGSEGPLEATLRPAVDTWIEVRSAARAPLKGARVASISIRTEENTETYIWRGTEHMLGFEFTTSDEAGKLKLPPLPEGALVDVRIDHPQWAQTKLSNAKATAGRLDVVYMPAGVMTIFEFIADSRTPMELDGLTCKALLLSQSSTSPETVRIPMTIAGNRIKFCAHPVTYSPARLTAPGVAITPHFDHLTIERDREKKVRFLVRKTVNASGRVMRRDGTPHKGAQVLGQIENLSPDGPAPGANEWAYSGSAETDDEGKFTIALAPGRSRVEINAEGFTTDRDYAELEVRAEGPNEVPDFVTDELQPVRGQVHDESGRPVPGAIVRVRFPSLNARQPKVSDAGGNYEIALPWVPVDLDTGERRYELDVAAFVAERPLMGLTRIDLRRPDSLGKVNIVLRPDSSPDSLLSLQDNEWSRGRKQKALAEQDEVERHPAGERGRPAPEFDGAAWFNTDARSLKDFRGRYVLLDFWFTGCGPCHADFPSVKLVHERFEKNGVTVIGVHDNSATPEAVREHCQRQGLTFPMVVDHTDGRVLNAYRQLGVAGFPTYILIGPDGNILENDRVTDGPSLRIFKLEVIRKYVLHRSNDN